MSDTGDDFVIQDPFHLLFEACRVHGHLTQPAKTQVALLLDTDSEIGKATGTLERRVGFIPSQADLLRRALTSLGLSPTLYVVRGAGSLAGFPDSEYEQAGATMVDVADLASLPVAPDVVHALKEPAHHEGMIPRSFMRIGALHLAAALPEGSHVLDPDHGVTALLKAKNFSSILDGSVLGSCSYLRSRANPTPVVASMSVFAGRIAAEEVVRGYTGVQPLSGGTVVIVGGGVACLAAAERLNGKCGRILVLEADEQRVRGLQEHGPGFALASGTRFTVQQNTPANLESALAGAVGLILAHRRGAQEATHVLAIEQLDQMALGAVIVDIPIDQGGSIRNPAIRDGADLVAIIEGNRSTIERMGRHYFAEPNMPRTLPREASMAHGSAILHYLAGLLLLCAIHGSAEQATRFLLERPYQSFTSVDQLPARYRDDFFEMLLQDLRNGIELACIHGNLEIRNPDIANNSGLVQALQDAWQQDASMPAME